ncbi:hypothetical protein [uncultured Alteromonas sp.]|jgi:hypothetical protein|uniref:hypothetical protein n=1 Tax=uncultured Alteromonas sp. TaxID=179113 RepID=UPI00258F1887|nr:hypothetical protein [uncultured Alteromonas sp.]
MIDKLKKQRYGYVVMLIMVISLVAKLSPGMAMPKAMSKTATVPVDAMYIEVNSENNSSEASRANKKNA